jgi:SdrD B-like domain/Bacterial TSP3 repeat
MKWKVVIFLVASSAVMLNTSRGASGTFSGRLWNDLNRDGIQDLHEPGLSNYAIVVYNDIILYLCGCVHYVCPLATNYTDAAGFYNFSVSNSNGVCAGTYETNTDFYVSFIPSCNALGISRANMGTNDLVDSDYQYCGIRVTNDNFAFTNIDIGLYYWKVGATFEMVRNDMTNANPLYVTSGAPVKIHYRITNTGETFVSSAFIVDDAFPDDYWSVDCPDTIYPGESRSFFKDVIVDTSITSMVFFAGFAVNTECNYMGEYIPFSGFVESLIVVVTNDPLVFADGDAFPNEWEMQYGYDPLNPDDPNANSDSDWMSDYEECIAGTNPTNPASCFPNAVLTDECSLMLHSSVVNRVYNIWRTTNLLGEPQEWSLLAPEQTGTGANLYFTIPVDDPSAQYRVGVRLP